MGQGLRTSLAGWFCFQSLICHLQSSEGLSGTRGSTSRLSHSHVCRLVVVVRRNPQFLPMGASPQAAWVSSPCDDWLPPEPEQSESVPVPYDLASESHTIVLAHLIGVQGIPISYGRWPRGGKNHQGSSWRLGFTPTLFWREKQIKNEYQVHSFQRLEGRSCKK